MSGEFGIDDFNFSSQSVSAVVIGCRIRVSGGTGTLKYRLSVDNGSTWCPSDHTDVVSTGSLVWETVTCTDHTFTNDNADDMMIRISLDGSASGWLNIYCAAVRVQITHTTTTSAPPAPPKPTWSAQTTNAYITSTILDTNGHGGGTPNNVQMAYSTSSTFATTVYTWTKGSAISSPQSYNFTIANGMYPDTTYYVRGRLSTTEDGYGNWSAGSPYNSRTTWDTPNLPTSLTGTSATEDDRIGLSWVAPSDQGGETIDEYHVWWREAPPSLPNSGDLKVWYKFNEDFNDDSGNSNHGTTNNNVTVTDIPTIGKNEEGANWNGANNSYVRIPNFAVTGDTVAFGGWMYPDGSGNQTVLGDAAQSNTVGFIWTYFTTLQLNFQYARAGSTRQTATWSNFLSGYTNQWVHVWIVADYTAKTVRAWRNGTLVASVAMTGTPVFPSTTRYRYVGNYSTNHSYSYNGDYDDFMLYYGSLAWDNADVTNIYNRRYTEIDTNSTSLTYTKTGLSAGTQYQFYIDAYNLVGRGDISAVYNHYTLCATPSAPTVTANGVKQLNVDWSGNSTTGAASTGAWKVERSDNGTSGWAEITGSPFALATTDVNDTVALDGEDYFYRVSLKNIQNNFSDVSGNGSATTWDVPSQGSDPTLDTPSQGAIRGAQPSQPADNGSTITHWQFELDNNAGFPSPEYQSGDIDEAIDGDTGSGLGDGNTYYGHVRWKNAVGYSAWSAGVVTETTWDVPNAQDLVSVTNPSVQTLRITRNGSYPDGNGDPVDSWEVWRATTEFGVYTEQASGLTATTWDEPFPLTSEQEYWYKAKFTNAVGDSVLSTNAISGQADPTQTFIPSLLKVRVEGQQTFLPTALSVLATSQISLPSALKVLVWRANFTPTVTYSHYELNDVTTSTIDTAFNMGLYEGYKTQNAVAVDPYENTMVNPDKHEFLYTLAANSGTMNFMQFPMSNGILSIDPVTSGTIFDAKFRSFGFDQVAWTGTAITHEVDIDGDWAGSGATVSLTGAWANTGTVWTPPSASGSNVFDVPSVYNASIMAVVQPSDWDLNPDHKIHDYELFAVSVGHAVEVVEFTFNSGSHEDSVISAYVDTLAETEITLKVYHEHPKEWEWFSGATKLESGTLTPSADTWQTLNEFSLTPQHLEGTYPYYLKLYCRSGSVVHPDPVRVVTVNQIVNDP